LSRFAQSQHVCLHCFCDVTDGLSLFDLFRSEDLLCGYCRQQLIPYRQNINVLDFHVYAYYHYDPFFEKLIFQIKESKDVTLAPVFLHPYVKHLRQMCLGKTLVLVPSSNKKLKERGFEPLRLFYEALACEMICPFEKDDIKQSQRSNTMRSRIKNHIRLIHPEWIKDKDIVLLDDVCTTGNSLKACIDLIKPYVRSIKVVVLAYHAKF